MSAMTTPEYLISNANNHAKEKAISTKNKNGEWVHAFVCDRIEALKGTEISHFKGWRHFKNSAKT